MGTVLAVWYQTEEPSPCLIVIRETRRKAQNVKNNRHSVQE